MQITGSDAKSLCRPLARHATLRMLCGLRALSTPVESMPEFTAFSRGTRVAIGSPNNQCHCFSMDRAGKDFQRFRTNRNPPHPRRFWADHDLFYRAVGRPAPNADDFFKDGQEAPPRRSVFGLPHNYVSATIRRSMDILKMGSGAPGKVSDLKRRASPVFLKIREDTEGLYPIWLAVPARFIPSMNYGTAALTVSTYNGIGKHRTPRDDLSLDSSKLDWSAVDDWMQELRNTSGYEFVDFSKVDFSE